MSRRSKLVILLLCVSLLLTGGLLFGEIGAALFGIEAPNWIAQDEPHVALPADDVTDPVSVGPLGDLAVTNTMLACWFTMIVLVVFSLVATRKTKLVPGRLQGLAEWVVEMLLNFVEGVAGKENGRKFFPVIATIFLFVIFNAYLALLPFFGASMHVTVHGHEVHLFRSANTDVNVPLAVALIAVFFVEYWGMRVLGGWSYLTSNFLNFGPLFRSVGKLLTGRVLDGLNGLLTGCINAFVGVIEVVSHLGRVVSFTFRLFGNMTAGEILLVVMAFLVPLLLPLPFYGLELLVGFIQALVFAGLTLVFATIATIPHEHEEE
jgi:F-type H+-transporting ATPase subunit a